MKKVLAFLAAFTFVLGLSVSAFATENSTPLYVDTPTVTIYKELAINNSGTVNPEETFNFEIGEGNGIRPGEDDLDAPAFSPNTFSITLAQGILLGSETLDLPEFAGVGVYTYPVTETAGDTAGMNYDAKIYQLIVTVINNPDFGVVSGAPEFLRIVEMFDGEDKDDTFDNDFDAGDLVIKKLVTGNFGSPDDEFEVTVTITPDTDPLKTLKMGPMTFTGSDSVVQAANGVITVVYTVKKGSVFTIENIPYDVSYTVVESPNTLNYNVTYANASGDFDDPTITATITNERNILPQTGINLDSLPYILLLSGAVIGMGVLFIRKRQNASF